MALRHRCRFSGVTLQSGMRESLVVVDVRRLATTRDRPSALSAASPRPSPILRLDGHQEGWTPPSRCCFRRLCVVTVVVVVRQRWLSANVCESEYVARVASGRTISCDRSGGISKVEGQEDESSALKDVARARSV